MKGKHILLGISGGIAAYKCCALVRLLIKQGAIVQVVLSPDAAQFVSPLTLSVLSKNKVLIHFTDENGMWNNHVDLALKADLFVIAPATANTLAKMAHGICDNLLLATYLSAKCKVLFAPAMDLDMYQHPAVKENIARLLSFGNVIIPSEYGELASGLVGEGRMAEPETIVSHISAALNTFQKLAGKKVLVTAGPTYEAIDPVRFIGNRSSGKMGTAIAQAFAEQGAQVTLICGPGVATNNLHSAITRMDVESALQMYDTCMLHFKNSDITIMAAAVADYKPVTTATQKIKKSDTEMQLVLTKNKDILLEMGANKKDKQVLIGFALETENEEQYAKDKLKRKNLDMIVLNSLNDKGAGFGTDTNKVSFIFNKKKKQINLPLMSKQEVATALLEEVISLL